MIYARDQLSTLIGSVLNVKKNCDPSQAEQFLNYRMRQILCQKPTWAGSIARGILPVPASYAQGTISTITGSNIVTGTGTAWPVDDVISTTLTAAVRQPGLQLVQPASMTNITADTWIYIDAAGANPEVVYVLDTTPVAFKAVFNFSHDVGATTTTSSFAYRTMRFGYQIPNFLITAVIDDSTLLLDQTFGGPAITNAGYTILKNIYNFAPDLKELLSVVDPQQGLELITAYPLGQLNAEDPQRAAVDFPRVVATHSMSPAGTAMFEIWPSPLRPRQLYFEYYKQQRDMKAPGDQLPPYIDGGVIVAGAIADALRTKVTEEDPYYDPMTANVWEQRFMDGVDKLVFADNSLYNQAYSWRRNSWGFPSGSNFWQAHDVDQFSGNY